MTLRFDTQIPQDLQIATLSADDTGRLVLSDSALLFSGAYGRSGQDLLISNEGSATVRIEGYFSQGAPADIYDTSGAVLRGDLVARLAGPLAPGQYAQAGGDLGPGPIGQVEVVEGTSTVQRKDGTVQTLQVGMKIFQNDVVATDAAGAVSLTFVDGTIFTLASSSRMVIDELIYDPSGADNSGVFNLIQGSFVFIAGQVAKTGGMEVNTPSSTMGIRGTTVIVKIESDRGVSTSEITLTTDPDGGQGRVELFDLDGNLIATISDVNSKWIVSPLDNETRQLDRTSLDDLEDGVLIDAAFTAFRAANSRIDAGETFVTLDNLLDRGSRENNGRSGPAELDVDSIDEPETIEAPRSIPNSSDGENDGSFDDGSLQTAPNPTIILAGLEDVAASGVISGIALISGNANAGLSFSLTTAPRNGAAFIDPSGAFRFVPNPDFNGTDSFTFTAKSSTGALTRGTIIVSVQPVNDSPQAADQTFTMLEDGRLVAAVSGFDIDGDPLTYSITEGPKGGEVVLLPDGSFTYGPDADFSGIDSFTVRLADPFAAFVDAVVFVSVLPVDDAPRVISPPESALGRVVDDSLSVTATGTLIALDPDGGGVPLWSGSGLGTYGAFSITAAGVWTYSLYPSAAEGLAAGETRLETFFVTATDEAGGSITQRVDVTVVGTNDAPVVRSGIVFEGLRDGAVEGKLTATDPDGTEPLIFSAKTTDLPNGNFELNPDGTFVYTPDDGFLGTETIEFTVTDPGGATTTGRASIEVESAVDESALFRVSVDVTEGAVRDSAAGAVEIDIETIGETSVNLAFLLDGSGSIGPTNWSIMLDAVDTAIVALQDQFRGTSTSVDIQFITFSSVAKEFGPYDLYRPGLSDAISALPYDGAITNWNLALDAAADFYFSQDPSETNFMLFITDGRPSNDNWVSSLATLQDPSDAFSVNIQAFGFGDRAVLGPLQAFEAANYALGEEPAEGPDQAEFLTSPEQLADALKGSPIFDPRLLSLEVKLKVDDGPERLLADENSDRLLVEGTNFELPLATIENIAMLLGESNRISVRAKFDIDRNEETAEIDVFTTELIGKAATAQNVAGLQGADLMFGSDFADTLLGGAGNDVILGYDGADVIDGGAGVDTVVAGAGDDVILVNELSVGGVEKLDGGAGRDLLKLGATGDINELLASLDLSDIEAIDMNNGQADVLLLTLADVVDLSTTGDAGLEALLNAALPESATIYGEAIDTLVLEYDPTGSIQQLAGDPMGDGNGNDLSIYQFLDGSGNVLATIGVDSDVLVETVAA